MKFLRVSNNSKHLVWTHGVVEFPKNYDQNLDMQAQFCCKEILIKNILRHVMLMNFSYETLKW